MVGVLSDAMMKVQLSEEARRKERIMNGGDGQTQREPKHILIMARLNDLHSHVCMLESLCDELNPAPPDEGLKGPTSEKPGPPTLGECLDHVFPTSIENLSRRVEQCVDRLRTTLF